MRHLSTCFRIDTASGGRRAFCPLFSLQVQLRSLAFTRTHTRRYLLQQGYGGKDGQPAICILTPYVGQLLRLRQAVAEVADLKFVLSSRDETDLGHVITDSSAADSPLEFESSSTGVGGSSPRAAAGAVGGGGGGSAVLSGAGSEVVTLGQSLRLATIDNFQ